ncbi:hypothetical protein [Streptomyces macrosporus]|uniref:hypothetical protein n=1 Tax=Streptomyces macrosporus TaxID=44032 RepID=UPI0031D12411
MGALLTVLSLVPAVACYFVFADWLPSDIKRYQDYVAADPCPAHAPAEEWEDCLRTVSFTVKDTEVKSGRSSSFVATLYGAPSWNGDVDFGDPGPLLEQLRPGDRVTGTVWRGDVVVISKGGVRQNSSDAPRDEPQMTAAIGTLTGLLAALGLGFGVVRLAGSRGHGLFTWRSFGKPLFFTMLITCFAVGFPALWLGLPWQAVPAVAVLAVACAAWLLHRYRRSAARS